MKRVTFAVKTGPTLSDFTLLLFMSGTWLFMPTDTGEAVLTSSRDLPSLIYKIRPLTYKFSTIGSIKYV